MNLSLNIILDQLRSLPLEVHIDDPAEKIFCRGALLPRDYRVMRKDLLHVCRLSDATACFRRCAGSFLSLCPGSHYRWAGNG